MSGQGQRQATLMPIYTYVFSPSLMKVQRAEGARVMSDLQARGRRILNNGTLDVLQSAWQHLEKQRHFSTKIAQAPIVDFPALLRLLNEMKSECLAYAHYLYLLSGHRPDLWQNVVQSKVYQEVYAKGQQVNFWEAQMPRLETMFQEVQYKLTAQKTKSPPASALPSQTAEGASFDPLMALSSTLNTGDDDFPEDYSFGELPWAVGQAQEGLNPGVALAVNQELSDSTSSTVLWDSKGSNNVLHQEVQESLDRH